MAKVYYLHLTAWRGKTCWPLLFYWKLQNNRRSRILLFLPNTFFHWFIEIESILGHTDHTLGISHFEYSCFSINADPISILFLLNCRSRSSGSEFTTLLQITAWFHQLQTYIKCNQKAIGSDHDASSMPEEMRAEMQKFKRVIWKSNPHWYLPSIYISIFDTNSSEHLNMGHWSTRNSTWALLSDKEKGFLESIQAWKVMVLTRCSRQCFSYTTGSQPGRTSHHIAIVQYIQHRIYPPQHSFSSQPNLTHQTRYSYSWSPPRRFSEPSVHTHHHMKPVLSLTPSDLLCWKQMAVQVPAPLRSCLSSGVPVQTGFFVLQLSEVNIPGNTLVPVYKF